MGKHIRFDWAMKRLLRNKANFDVLEGFLSVLLNQSIKINEILESESNKDSESDKYNRVDILVKNANEELMLIEVQNERENDYFHRMNFGQAKLTTQYLYVGEKYGQIKKVYSINIVYFDLGHGDDYVYTGRTEFRGLHTHNLLQLDAAQKKVYPVNEISDIFATYYLLKVNNFNGLAVDSLDEWIYFLKNSEIKDEFKAQGLVEAKEKLRQDTLSPEEKISYELYIKQKRIQENVLESALIEGEINAEKKYKPLLEEAKARAEEAIAREEEAKAREEKANNRIKKSIQKRIQKGHSVESIAEDFEMSVIDVGKLLK